MTFSIECPECGKTCKAKPSEIGKMRTCPDCESEFEIRNPNLIPCPDCFEPVSRRASACPHCGAPLSGGSRSGGPDDDAFRNEREISVCHPSLKYYLGTFILGIVTLPVLIGVYLLARVWIETHLTSYRITNLRIVVKRGWISKTQREIWIKDMRGANLIQNAWQRIIGIGDVSIGTAATAETEICLAGVNHPQEIVDQINALRH